MTRCRLYIDEVGNGDLSAASDNPNERYLSLTGIITKTSYYDKRFIPEVNSFKEAIFGSDGANIILHRREIVRKEGAFCILKDAEVREKFDCGLLTLFERLPYLASTITIDKKKHFQLYGIM